MEEETQVEEELTESETEQQEQATFTEQEEPEPQAPVPVRLAQEKVNEALTKTHLPPASVLKLAEAEYEDESGLADAIKVEVAEVKRETGSGAVFGQGEGTAPPARVPLTEKERVEKFNLRCAEVGLSPIPVPM